MGFLQQAVDFLNQWTVQIGIPVGDQQIPFMVILLVGTGFFLTVRLGFVQIRHFGHGVAVATGKYDDPSEPGDVTHFQALTTALSATVGIGNIAGVALAIHWGGPGALFWMWVTAAVGMATKYSEVTLAQKYRSVAAPDEETSRWSGTVSGGPMYYIERGLGPRWRWMAVFFAAMLAFTAFLTGNAIQANTIADIFSTRFGIPAFMVGIVTTSIVAAVVLGGITRIGRFTGVLAPFMAAIYVAGALLILVLNFGSVPGAFLLIFQEAFSPSAGVAGTGVGAVLITMMYGVNRGLFSNEAGQGSAPIAHAAAKTDEPVSEGVVALLEPFIDTIVIVTLTALVIIITGVWSDRFETEITLSGGDLAWVAMENDHFVDVVPPAEIRITDGVHADPSGVMVGWHNVSVDELFVDQVGGQRFSGVVQPANGVAVGDDGQTYTSLWGNAAEEGAPLTMNAFSRGLSGFGNLGEYIVLLSVFLFGVSTAISWSYYGDRCAMYLFGKKALGPYKMMFVTMHFVGAVVPLGVIWSMGDVALSIVIWPNLVALILLSGQVREITDSYFERKPWLKTRH